MGSTSVAYDPVTRRWRLGSARLSAPKRNPAIRMSTTRAGLWRPRYPRFIQGRALQRATDGREGGDERGPARRVPEATKARAAPASLAENRFRVGKDIAVARFTVRNDTIVLVRVVCQAPRHPPAMISCLLAVPDHERLERAIESAIGALAEL